MALEVIWTKRAKKSFDKIVDNIESNWSENSAKKFVRETAKVLDLISKSPKMFRESQIMGIRQGLITKQTSVYYRIFKKAIRIITFWDNRRNPDNLKL